MHQRGWITFAECFWQNRRSSSSRYCIPDHRYRQISRTGYADTTDQHLTGYFNMSYQKNKQQMTHRRDLDIAMRTHTHFEKSIFVNIIKSLLPRNLPASNLLSNSTSRVLSMTLCYRYWVLSRTKQLVRASLHWNKSNKENSAFLTLNTYPI